MTGFELRISGVGSDHSTNFATTTTAQLLILYHSHPLSYILSNTALSFYSLSLFLSLSQYLLHLSSLCISLFNIYLQSFSLSPPIYLIFISFSSFSLSSLSLPLVQSLSLSLSLCLQDIFFLPR